MDFEFDEAQRVIATSAAEVLRKEQADAQAAWQGLASAGLLALTLPTWLGGDELGVVEAAVLLTEVGRQASSLPALATIMLGALPVVRWGSREQAEQLLAGIGAGKELLTAAVREPSLGLTGEPLTRAAPDGTITGIKVGVPYAAESARMLVPAMLPEGARGVVVVARSAPGVTTARTPASGDAPEYTVRLDSAPIVGVLGDDSDRRAAAAEDLRLLALVGAAAMADGALAGALALTAEHVASREQFGRPLATFQAVSHQVADIYITSRTLHLAALSACWRLAAGLDAGEDADVAAYWLAHEAPAAIRCCHHLHGGIGMDVSYPLHRYSAMISDLVRFVGGAEQRVELLARTAPCRTVPCRTVPCSST